jgi:hypothetical protein
VSQAKPGTYTLQLVLDQGAWEEVLTLDPDDADNLQDLLSNTPPSLPMARSLWREAWRSKDWQRPTSGSVPRE